MIIYLITAKCSRNLSEFNYPATHTHTHTHTHTCMHTCTHRSGCFTRTQPCLVCLKGVKVPHMPILAFKCFHSFKQRLAIMPSKSINPQTREGDYRKEQVHHSSDCSSIRTPTHTRTQTPAHRHPHPHTRTVPQTWHVLTASARSLSSPHPSSHPST